MPISAVDSQPILPGIEQNMMAVPSTSRTANTPVPMEAAFASAGLARRRPTISSTPNTSVADSSHTSSSNGEAMFGAKNKRHIPSGRPRSGRMANPAHAEKITPTTASFNRETIAGLPMAARSKAPAPAASKNRNSEMYRPHGTYEVMLVTPSTNEYCCTRANRPMARSTRHTAPTPRTTFLFILISMTMPPYTRPA